MNKTLAWGGYILAALMATSAALYKAGVITKAMRQVGIDIQQENKRLEWLRHMHRQMDAMVPAGATIVLGDSFAQGLATSAVAPFAESFAIGGQRSDELLVSMDDYHALQRAGRVVVGPIGVNDIVQGREAGLEGRYRAILTKIPAGVPVFFNGLPPSADPEYSLRFRAAGELAKSVCAADQRCHFLDLWSAMTVNGAPRPGLLAEDGTHLSPQGYALWIEMLRQSLRTNEKAPEPKPGGG